MPDTDFKIGEGTLILRYHCVILLSIIGGVAISRYWLFSRIDERIMLLEHEQVRMLR